MQTATTADEAFALYRAALEQDALIQLTWHTQDGKGRKLACALGVLGPEVNNPKKCPASVMPRWLAQMVPWFFDNQNFTHAKVWGLAFYTQLARLDGVVPFSVVHDWQANIVGPLAIEVSQKRGRNVATHEALAAMHRDALAGKKFTANDWYPILKSAFSDADVSDADADADAEADAYADANAEAVACAYANANAEAVACAYANACADAYAHAYANANAEAVAYADSYADAYADAYAYACACAKKSAVERLADGMVECLARVAQ